MDYEDRRKYDKTIDIFGGLPGSNHPRKESVPDI